LWDTKIPSAIDWINNIAQLDTASPQHSTGHVTNASTMESKEGKILAAGKTMPWSLERTGMPGRTGIRYAARRQA
jgi:hypothetical protein